ncbi:Geraniol 8-hydroxylase [Heracleum sosnowskyi]|uniref:Geraniol 8-hydroxylase n=1 Tax=Heracleum sosnowskyi TaxID=360622 RepID=A0AAD8H5H6_9APIA|nr:Geraniol 8-hydroxylase [Heracleum sosnowskyi]
MEIFIISLLCIFLAFSLLSIQRNRGKAVEKLPPGPNPLPIIGNIHQLGKQPHKSVAKLAQVYGPIMRLELGRKTTIVISSSTAARQVLQKQDLAFSTRALPDAAHACNHSKSSVVWLPVGNQWRSIRKILSSYIFTSNKLDANQHLRISKVQELVEYCNKCSESGEAIDIGHAAFQTSFNLLSKTIFSKDMADLYHSTDSKELKDLVWNIMLEAGKPNLVDYFPILSCIDPQGIKRRISVHFGKLLKLFDGMLNERLELKRLGNSDDNTDVLEQLLKLLQTNEIDKPHINHLFMDLFAAGTDTTSNTLEWAMAEVLKNSETVLAKAKAELTQVIGKGKIVEEANISKLKYLSCIVKETGRLHPPVPFLLPRQVVEDVELCGYTIPKNSQVLVNAWAIGRDPILWKNPLSFQPERFMDSEIDVYGHDFELIPFGAGRRKCPGLPLAMRMLPIMLGSLINCFDWKLEGGIATNELDMEDKFGLTLAKFHPLRAVATPVVP